MKRQIYNMVEKYALDVASGEKLTVYHMLYGYAKVCAINNVVLSVLVNSDADACEKVLDKLNGCMKAHDYSVSQILSEMVYILLKKEELGCTVDVAKEILERFDKDDENYLYQVLEAILGSDIPEKEVFSCEQEEKDKQEVEERVEKRRLERKKREEAERIREEAEERKKKAEEKTEEQTAGQMPQKDSDATPGREQLPPGGDTEEDTSDDEEANIRAEAPAEGGLNSRFSRLVGETQHIYDELQKKVKGQNEALRKLVQGYFDSQLLSHKSTKRPQGTFLFAGPPGVGKTYTAETLAELSGRPYLRVDMSEYCDEYSDQVFAGSQANYKNPKPGTVTTYVSKNPNAIILFDEIEKASNRLILLFLQILEGGCCTDAFTEENVSFTDTILIFTTNVGKSLYADNYGKNLSAMPQNLILDAIREEKRDNGKPAFPPEICSRFASGNIIMFNHLGAIYLREIAEKKFKECGEDIHEEYNINVEFDPLLSSVFLFSQSEGLDARVASSQSEKLIRRELYEFGRIANKQKEALAGIEKVQFMVGVPERDSEVYSLFKNTAETNILIISDKEISRDLTQLGNYQIYYAKSVKEMYEIIEKVDITMVLVDVLFSMYENDKKYLSQDDIRSVGRECLHKLAEKFSSIPIYLIENNQMNKEDRDSFYRVGVKQVISVDHNDKIVAKELIELSERLFLQQCAEDLDARGRVLHYETAQYLTDNDKCAVICFYNFSIALAAKGEQQKMLLAPEQRPKERFKDVIGAKKAKEELEYYVKKLKSPKGFAKDGIEKPKGVLLYGPPGTGKTMLARAMAGECNVTFLSTTAAGFLHGSSQNPIKELFATARKFAPAILFIDEIDAIGKERTGSEYTQYAESLLNTLLTEMDGFEVDLKHPVFVLAATNFDLDKSKSSRAKVIDPALLRRFAPPIYVDLPNQEERKQYLDLMNKKKMGGSVSQDVIDNVAQRTTGRSLSIMEGIIEAAIKAAVKNGGVVTDKILLDALDECQYGTEHKWSDDYYRSVAYHEAGHAYLNWKAGNTPAFITIVSRGDFGGYVMPGSDEDTPSYNREQFLWKIRESLAGRAAEIVKFGEEAGTNTGIGSDLRAATNYAMMMICQYGMQKDQLFSIKPDVLLNSPYAKDLIAQVNEMLQTELKNTIDIVREGWEKIERLANHLIKENQIVGPKIVEIFENEEE